MREVVEVLQTGIILTTPVFFVVTLLALWRLLRAVDSAMSVSIHVKRQIEVMGRGGLAVGVRPTQAVRDVEQKHYPGESEERDEDHRG